MQAGEDDRQIDGAETRGDGREAGRRGAERDGVGEMAAIGKQDANDMEECADALGRGGWTLAGGCFTLHDSHTNRMQSLWQDFAGPLALCPREKKPCLIGAATMGMDGVLDEETHQLPLTFQSNLATRSGWRRRVPPR
jgi:hypothetical protein